MPDRQSKSFVEVTFIEAAARRIRADLVMEPIVPGGERRLISRLIGVENPDRLVLTPPVTARGEKVFVPTGWELGISFDLANVWFQATTKVIEHCMFYQAPTRRIDALAVRMPEKLLEPEPPPGPPPSRRPRPAHVRDDLVGRPHRRRERRAPRHGQAPGLVGHRPGRSAEPPIDLPTGSETVICLNAHETGESQFVRATLRHCTPLGDGAWVAGFGDIAALRPAKR